ETVGVDRRQPGAALLETVRARAGERALGRHSCGIALDREPDHLVEGHHPRRLLRLRRGTPYQKCKEGGHTHECGPARRLRQHADFYSSCVTRIAPAGAMTGAIYIVTLERAKTLSATRSLETSRDRRPRSRAAGTREIRPAKPADSAPSQPSARPPGGTRSPRTPAPCGAY